MNENEKLKKIIERLKNNPNKILNMTYVAKEYTKLDLINDLEEIVNETEIQKET